MATNVALTAQNQKRRRIYDQLVSERSNIEGTWNQIEKFISPFRTRFFEETLSEGGVNWRRRELMDSTAVRAAPNLAASMHAGITNPQFQWYDIRFRDPILNKNTETKKWLEFSAREAFLTIQESNFNTEVNEVYLDLATMGIASIIEEVAETPQGGFEGLIFKTVPQGQVVFERDAEDKLISFYRRLHWNPVKIMNKFPAETIPDHIVKKLESPSGRTEEITVIMCVYKRKEIPEVPEGARIVAPELRPYGQDYFLYDTCESVGPHGGYYEMPAFCPRWGKTAGSTFGFSPAMICLPDVLTLNELIKTDLIARGKAADPPVLVTRRGVFGNLDVSAGGVNQVMTKDSLSYMDSHARFDVIDSLVMRLQSSIERTFMIDQLELKESPAMTATEVMARMQLMQRLLGPTHGRIEAEFLDPLIETTFNILFRHGMLPEPPKGVDLSAAALDIEYLGPTARAQKLDQVTAMERWVADGTAMAQTYPEVVDVVDPIPYYKELGKNLGVPSLVMRSDSQITQKQNERKKAQEEAMKTMQMQQGGDAAKSVGEGAQALQEGGVDAEQIAGATEGTA